MATLRRGFQASFESTASFPTQTHTYTATYQACARQSLPSKRRRLLKHLLPALEMTKDTRCDSAFMMHQRLHLLCGQVEMGDVELDKANNLPHIANTYVALEA